MQVNRENKLFTIKNLLVLLICITTVFICYYIKQINDTNEKWIQVSQIQDIENMDSEYLYCTSYNTVKKEKLKTITLILSFSCVAIGISIWYISISGKNNRKEKNNLMLKSIMKNEKNVEIISKLSCDEEEMNLYKILNSNFTHYIYNMFCDLQTACMNSNYKVLQNVLTQELYDKYCKSLAILKQKSRKIISTDFELIDFKIIDSKEYEDEYIVKVNLIVKYYGYIIDLKNNEVLKGSKDKKITNKFKLTLIKNKKDSKWLISEKEKINEN